MDPSESLLLAAFPPFLLRASGLAGNKVVVVEPAEIAEVVGGVRVKIPPDVSQWVGSRSAPGVLLDLLCLGL